MLILDFMCRPWSRQRRWNTTRRPCIAPNMIIFTLRRSTGTCQTNFISCICVTWVSSRPTHHRYLSPGGEPRAQYKACFIPYLFWIHYHLALDSRLMEPEIILCMCGLKDEKGVMLMSHHRAALQPKKRLNTHRNVYGSCSWSWQTALSINASALFWGSPYLRVNEFIWTTPNVEP